MYIEIFQIAEQMTPALGFLMGAPNLDVVTPFLLSTAEVISSLPRLLVRLLTDELMFVWLEQYSVFDCWCLLTLVSSLVVNQA